MSAEYDLVIIGNSPEGIQAAIMAASLNARVALVKQDSKQDNFSYSQTVANRTWAHLGHKKQKLQELGLDFNLLLSPYQWTETVLANLQELQSPALLAALGVDLVVGEGEFCRLPHLAFVVAQRRLQAHSYLLAMGSCPQRPQIEGIEQVIHLGSTILQKQDSWDSLPQNLAVVGFDSRAVELAQTLVYWGKNITLITAQESLLPYEEPEAELLLQAQLEGEGVHLVTGSTVTQVKQIGEQKWLQAGNRAIEVDEIIWVAQQKPKLAKLNFEGVGVICNQKGVVVNEKLQTTNPRIYACGDVLGGYRLAHIAQYEATIAVKNALFFPWFKVNYQVIPWVIFTEPSLARVGMTENQAKARYGKEVFVVKQYFKNVTQAIIRDATTGFCKLVVRHNGEILGACIVGQDAGELIGTIAVAIKEKIKLGQLSDIPSPLPTMSAIISQTALEWQQQSWRRNRLLRSWLEFWWHWRRN